MKGLVLVALSLFAMFNVAQAIFNGEVASQGQYPYLVYIMIDPGTSGTYACGGGFISKRYIMSAAHCSYGTVFKAIVGRISVKGYPLSSLVNITKVTRPSDFGALGWNSDDVAIFELDRDVDEVPGYIEYMNIGLTAPVVGAKISLAGFGMLGPQNQTAQVHYGSTFIAEDSQCRFSTYVPSLCLCTNNPNLYSCPGDSGSPIVVKPTGSSKFVVVGIDSYGHSGECGDKAYDSVLGKVASFVQFISDNTPLAPPTFATLDFSNPQQSTLLSTTVGPLTATTSSPTVGGITPMPTTSTPQPQCWTCAPGLFHWWELGIKEAPEDKCACIATAGPSTIAPCWTCPEGNAHWYDLGMEEPEDRCACYPTTAPTGTSASTTTATVTTSSPSVVTTVAVTSAPTTTTTAPTTTTASATTAATLQPCWTCSSGYAHWWELGMEEPKDRCACVKVEGSLTTATPTTTAALTTTSAPTTSASSTTTSSPTSNTVRTTMAAPTTTLAGTVLPSSTPAAITEISQSPASQQSQATTALPLGDIQRSSSASFKPNMLLIMVAITFALLNV